MKYATNLQKQQEKKLDDNYYVTSTYNKKWYAAKDFIEFMCKLSLKESRKIATISYVDNMVRAYVYREV